MVDLEKLPPLAPEFAAQIAAHEVKMTAISDRIVAIAEAVDAEIGALRAEISRLTAALDEEHAAAEGALMVIAQERAEIARLKAEVRRLSLEALAQQDGELLAADMHRQRAHSLAVAIMGGEDAPGYAESVDTDTLVEMMRQSRIRQNRADDRCDEFERARDRARRHSERLTAGIRAVLEDEIARPLGERWRADGEPSSHDLCIHGAMMNEDCPDCLEAHLSALIASPEVPEDRT